VAFAIFVYFLLKSSNVVGYHSVCAGLDLTRGWRGVLYD